MLASFISSIFHSFNLSKLADNISSVSIDSYNCNLNPFSPLVSSVRNFKGQRLVSKRILEFIKGGDIETLQKKETQDPYSFRCIPQVHGASLDVINHVESIFQTEVDSVTDNPLVFSEEDSILSAGNFHGQPLAKAMDYLAIAISEIGSISERRIFKLISGERSLPLYLTSNPGLKSGSMITQYTAASIVSQNKQYCSPSSVDSIVSSNGQEDHVSMGANAATKLYKVIANTQTILSIELFNAIQAMHFKKSFENTSIIIKKLISNMKDEDCFPKLDKADDFPVRNEIDLISRFVREFDVLSFLNIGD